MQTETTSPTRADLSGFRYTNHPEQNSLQVELGSFLNSVAGPRVKTPCPVAWRSCCNFASISLSTEGEFGRLLLSINPPGNSYCYLDMAPNMRPRFSGDSQTSWTKPQVCKEARGMSQGLQGLTKHSFLCRRPDQGDGLSGNCNVDILRHTRHMESTHGGFCLTERQGARQGTGGMVGCSWTWEIRIQLPVLPQAPCSTDASGFVSPLSHMQNEAASIYPI